MAGVYIHVPFCKQACNYCDFHFSTNLGLKGDLTKAIAQELSLQRNYVQGEEVKTVYFGGGTPSLLSSKELEIIFNSICNNFSISSSAEVTLEANPDDLTKEKLKDLKNTGVNRLSIGIQSFDDTVLKFLNRAHNSQHAIICVEEAQSLGFTNISIDLIYAIPNQHEKAWSKNIEQALALRPQHISSYSLTIEEKTVFGRWSHKGKLAPVEDDIAADQLEILIEALEREGFEHYEVSNFAKPGFISQHNSNYWRQELYLGVGPSAHSYNYNSRQSNVSSNYGYLKSLKEDKIPATIEPLTVEDKINDYLLTGLRTTWGVDLQKLNQELGYDILYHQKDYINSLLNKNLAKVINNILVLTRAGRFLSDRISSDLFVTKLSV